MSENRFRKKQTVGLREAALAGVAAVAVGAVTGVALEGKSKNEPTRETAGEEVGRTEDSGKRVVTHVDSGQNLNQARERVDARDQIALEMIRHLPDGYNVEPKGGTITIVSDQGKEMGNVRVDPNTSELTFQPPAWAVSSLDALGDFQIDQFSFTDPADIEQVAQDMQKIEGWAEEFDEFKQAASEDLFGNVGSSTFEEDIELSNKAIEDEQRELIQKVQDETNKMTIKIH